MKRPLSIAIIRQRFAQDGGAERFVARMLEALKGEDVRITLISRKWEQVPDVDVIRADPFYLGRLWRDWSFSRAVCKLLKSRKFDLVQSHERIPCCDIFRAGDGVHREWLRQLGRARGPLGRLLLALNPYHLYVKWAERRLFMSPQLKVVICNSKMVKEEIRKCFGLPEKKLHVIFNGVDTEVFHPRLKQQRAEVRARYRIPEDATLFVFVGSGFERKGLAILLKAMSHLPKNTYLLVVGRDRKLTRYQQLARHLGLAERTFFLGSQPDVRPFYGSADALVLPTIYDPFPNVTLEAMAAGLPVITSCNSGSSELIEHGKNGFVCEAMNTLDLLECMQSLILCTSPKMMSVASRHSVEHLDLKYVANQLGKLYVLQLAST